jgi:predicted DNA binding protein
MLFVADGADPEDVAAAAREHADVTDVTVVSGGDGEGVVEFAVSDPPIVSELAERGAETTAIVAETGQVRITLELPASADPRSVIEQLSERYPSTDLLARHERERTEQTKQELVAEIEDRLTSRQQLALQKAYLGGFFDWPRSISGEDLAESMDISPSTYHQHLRAAEKKVLASLFEE